MFLHLTHYCDCHAYVALLVGKKVGEMKSLNFQRCLLLGILSKCAPHAREVKVCMEGQEPGSDDSRYGSYIYTQSNMYIDWSEGSIYIKCVFDDSFFFYICFPQP